MTLDEILREEERLRMQADAYLSDDARRLALIQETVFYAEHGPRLAAVARALVNGAKTHSCACDILDEIAFDAALGDVAAGREPKP